VFLVPTGTAANALALAHLTPPWGAVLCHDEAHIATDECGAPEFFGGGIKLVGLAGAGGKIAPATLQRALDEGQWGGPHHVSPAVLSLSQATEAGTVYRADEIRQLADIAPRPRRLPCIVDGARIANALARMNASPGQATWMAGVDVLSFGATKGGAMAAEAVVFFDPARGRQHVGASQARRPSHLQHRFVAAQIEAYFAGDLWLALARHANAMADRLAGGLIAAGSSFVWPVEANEVFVALPLPVDARLKAAGASYYPWTTNALPNGVTRDTMLVRLVTSFATTAAEVDRFVATTMCFLMTRQRQSYAQFRLSLRHADAQRFIASDCIALAASIVASRGNQHRGNSILKHKIALCAALAARVCGIGTRLGGSPHHRLLIPAPAIPSQGLPPHEIVTIVRSTGLEPLGSPVRQGPAYALRAVDPAVKKSGSSSMPSAGASSR